MAGSVGLSVLQHSKHDCKGVKGAKGRIAHAVGFLGLVTRTNKPSLSMNVQWRP